jgi:hypothetical protein
MFAGQWQYCQIVRTFGMDCNHRHSTTQGSKIFLHAKTDPNITLQGHPIVEGPDFQRQIREYQSVFDSVEKQFSSCRSKIYWMNFPGLMACHFEHNKAIKAVRLQFYYLYTNDPKTCVLNPRIPTHYPLIRTFKLEKILRDHQSCTSKWFSDDKACLQQFSQAVLSWEQQYRWRLECTEEMKPVCLLGASAKRYSA